LRHRVAKPVNSKIGTKEEIAKTFPVSTSWIRKLLQRRSEAVSIDLLPRTQGRNLASMSRQSDFDAGAGCTVCAPQKKPEKVFRTLSGTFVTALF